MFIACGLGAQLGGAEDEFAVGAAGERYVAGWRPTRRARLQRAWLARALPNRARLSGTRLARALPHRARLCSTWSRAWLTRARLNFVRLNLPRLPHGAWLTLALPNRARLRRALPHRARRRRSHRDLLCALR